jgi:hypothetical protein
MSLKHVNKSGELVNMSIEPLCMSRETFSMIMGTFNISLIMYWGTVNSIVSLL